MSETQKKALTFTGVLIVFWGVLGNIYLIGNAIWRLTPLAIEPIEKNMLSTWHWIVYITWCIMNAYMEGYKGFQKSFSPQLVERALYLGRNPTLGRVIFAPLFCMGLFHATKRRLIVSWCVLLGVISLIILIRMLSQPWRGIIDAGVVIGLGLGLLSILYCLFRGLTGNPIPVRNSIPELEPAKEAE